MNSCGACLIRSGSQSLGASDAASDQTFVEALRTAGGSVVLPSFKQPAAMERLSISIVR